MKLQNLGKICCITLKVQFQKGKNGLCLVLKYIFLISHTKSVDFYQCSKVQSQSIVRNYYSLFYRYPFFSKKMHFLGKKYRNCFSHFGPVDIYRVLCDPKNVSRQFQKYSISAGPAGVLQKYDKSVNCQCLKANRKQPTHFLGTRTDGNDKSNLFLREYEKKSVCISIFVCILAFIQGYFR